MATTIAVAGKGGTGKTTTSGLIVSSLKKMKKTPILAIDADPNVNLNQVLGIEVEGTIGQMREDVLKNIDQLPAGVPKESYLEMRIQESISEGEGFDLLVMGRPEGQSCYCYANSILRRYIDILSKSYKFVVIDSEAGMEHLSRRTTQNVDYLLLISDAAIRSIQAAGRIRDLALEMELKIGEMWSVITRVPSTGLDEILAREIKKQKLNVLTMIPQDPKIMEFDLHQKPITELSEKSPAFRAVYEMIEGLLREHS